MEDITPTQIKEWLARIGKDRAWLAEQTLQSESTVNNWLARNKPRVINPHALRIIKDLMKEREEETRLDPVIPVSLWRQAKADAAREGISIDEWMAMAFEAKLKHTPKPRSAAKPKK